MKGYPLFLKLDGEPCFVLGGGKVAFRKIQALIRRGAKVTCVSQEFSTALKNLAKRNRRQIALKRSPRRQISFNGARLVIAATSDHEFNVRVARQCRRKKILVNVVDEPRLCDFYVPAVLERGPLQVAISTGGLSPLFAKRLREALEEAIPLSTGRLLEKLGKIRSEILRKGGSAR